MGTYVLMRILESAPRRYELGIRLLTLGSIDRAYDRLASHVGEGQHVLDLGCGTGALTLRAARRGASVKGIDISARMLEIAAERVRDAGLGERIELAEAGIAELDGEEPDSYDVVTCGLCFSELSDDEQRFALSHVRRILRPGGLLLVADEVKPPSLAARVTHAVVRAPLVALTYLITQQTTQPVDDLSGKLEAAGLTIESVRSSLLSWFVEVVARKPNGAEQ